MIVEGPDGREYGYAADAGQRLIELGHANGPGLVRRWKAAGHLVPARVVDGRPVYAIADVMRVELAMRRSRNQHPGRGRLTLTG